MTKPSPHAGFAEAGRRMLTAWSERIQGLRDQRVYAMGDWQAGAAFTGFSDPLKLKTPKSKIGRSPLLGKR